MAYGPAPIQSIKSSNQRALLAQWQTLSAGRTFPDISEFTPPERDAKQLVLWDVEDDGVVRRFRMRKLGQAAAEGFAGDYTGKTMDEVVPEPLRSYGLESANACADSGCAAYSIISIINPMGHQVDCERLLLPFGRDGAVEQIVAALQLISFQGAVERAGIAHEFENRSSVIFAGLIPAAAVDGASGPIVLPPPPKRVAPPVALDALATAAEHDNAPPAHSGAEKRRAQRRNVHKTGKITARKFSEVCSVRNISASGAAIEVPDAQKVPEHFTLVLEMESAARSCTVVWRKDRQIGVEFR